MAITEEEKQYIIEEETLRFETKKKLMQEEFGRWGHRGPGMGWHGYGCHRHFWGFGILKVLLLVLVIVGLSHLWRGGACGWGPAYYAPVYPAPQAAPAVPPAVKN
jgi:hypothetical protein